MRRKRYYGRLISALRETLKHIEGTSDISADDPVLQELKASILRRLAEDDMKSEDLAPAQLS